MIYVLEPVYGYGWFDQAGSIPLPETFTVKECEKIDPVLFSAEVVSGAKELIGLHVLLKERSFNIYYILIRKKKFSAKELSSSLERMPNDILISGFCKIIDSR